MTSIRQFHCFITKTRSWWKLIMVQEMHTLPHIHFDLCHFICPLRRDVLWNNSMVHLITCPDHAERTKVIFRWNLGYITSGNWCNTSDSSDRHILCTDFNAPVMYTQISSMSFIIKIFWISMRVSSLSNTCSLTITGYNPYNILSFISISVLASPMLRHLLLIIYMRLRSIF